MRGLTKPNTLVGKGLLAALDQGIYSITMFATSVVLARSLSPAEYGVYSLAFATLLFVGMLQDALVTEPLLVYGASKYHRAFGPYLRTLAKWQIAVTAGVSVCVVAAIAIAPGLFPHPWSANILGLALAMPAILLAWLVRRAFYANTDPGGALLNSLAQALCILVGLYVVVTANRMTALFAFLILGAGALVSASLGWWRIHVASRDVCTPFVEREAVADHWRYGRWLVLSNVPGWVVLHGYTMLAGVLLGLKDVAGLRAMQTLVAPIAVMLNAFGTLSLPWLVRQRAQGGLKRLETSVSSLTWLFAGLALLIVGPLLAFGGPLTSFLYHGRYVEYVWLLPYLGAAQVLASGAIGLGLGLRSFEASRRLLMASLMAAASVATVGYVTIRLAGLPGLGLGVVVTQMVLAGALFAQLRYERRERAGPGPHPETRWASADRVG